MVVVNATHLLPEVVKGIPLLPSLKEGGVGGNHKVPLENVNALVQITLHLLKYILREGTKFIHLRLITNY